MSPFLWWILVMAGGAVVLSLLVTIGIRLLFLIDHWLDCAKRSKHDPEWKERAKERHEKGVKECDYEIEVLRKSLKEDGIGGDLDPLDSVISLTESGSVRWEYEKDTPSDDEAFQADLTE